MFTKMEKSKLGRSLFLLDIGTIHEIQYTPEVLCISNCVVVCSHIPTAIPRHLVACRKPEYT